MRLDIQCEEELAEAREFADKVGLRENLEERLEYLAGYSGRPGRCALYKDFAPYSFGFTILVEDESGVEKRWFKGGLIYHGPHDGFGDGGAPTFSVSLSPEHGWSIHT